MAELPRDLAILSSLNDGLVRSIVYFHQHLVVFGWKYKEQVIGKFFTPSPFLEKTGKLDLKAQGFHTKLHPYNPFGTEDSGVGP